MLKKLFLLTLFSLCLIAGDKVEIYASHMNSKDNVVEASGGISVVYDKYLLTADRAIYDRKSGDLELFDNIRVNYGSAYKILGKYAKLNIEKKEKFFKPFYMADTESRVWMSAQDGAVTNKNTDLKSGVVSGCNPVDPLWKLEFTSSDYNSQTKWLNLYNTRLYIGDILVFYTPYFGYSLDKTRRTGLLMPSIGLSGDEGFYYKQPIYIAEQNWWDLELDPQIRTLRGKGIYTNFRFVESPTAKGEFKLGYFKEQGNYVKEHDLLNDSHYGFNFNYENSNFLSSWFDFDFSGQSGIYADTGYMNDVDYINLSSNDTTNNSTATQVLSRVNIFYNEKHNYIGTYFKYYQDLTKSNNNSTLQKLPTIEYHYYLNTLLQDHLLYSLDAQSNNITRREGVSAVQTYVSLPVTAQTSLFDEYLNLSYRANLSLEHSAFYGSDTSAPIITHEDGYVFRNYHTLKASTELTKAYKDFSHVISFGVTYNKKGSESKKGYYENNSNFCSQAENQEDERCEFYNISVIKEEAQVDFTQYLFDDKGKQFVYHRLAQKISYGDNGSHYGELENELDYQVTDYLSIYNNMFYNYDEHNFSKIFNRITVNKFGLNVSLSHLYKDTFIDSTPTTKRHTSYLTSNVTYKYNSHYSFSGIYNYDTITNEAKNREIGFLYQKRCWNFGLRYSENRRPVLTTNSESYVDEKYIYLTIVLKPIMRSDGSSLMTFRLPNRN